LTICPSCGSKVESDLCAGCPSCGARAIGPPLAKPEYQLTSYGLSLAAFASGILMLVVFLGSLISVLVENKSVWLRFAALMTAGEVAAWRLKWVALPIAFGVLWFSAKSIQIVKINPSKFSGLRVARLGFASASVTTLLIATLIGITVPERLRRHQWAVEAESQSRWYTFNSALVEYKALKGTYPSDPKDILREIPDPYGTIADALASIDLSGYQPSTVVASASTKVKPLALRGGVLRNTSLGPNVESSTDRGVSFTNYELRLAGPDKIMFTDDDLIMRDGVIMAASELSRRSSASAKQSTP
jgi:hypothetical protein